MESSKINHTASQDVPPPALEAPSHPRAEIELLSQRIEELKNDRLQIIRYRGLSPEEQKQQADALYFILHKFQTPHVEAATISEKTVEDILAKVEQHLDHGVKRLHDLQKQERELLREPEDEIPPPPPEAKDETPFPFETLPSELQKQIVDSLSTPHARIPLAATSHRIQKTVRESLTHDLLPFLATLAEKVQKDKRLSPDAQTRSYRFLLACKGKLEKITDIVLLEKAIIQTRTEIAKFFALIPQCLFSHLQSLPPPQKPEIFRDLAELTQTYGEYAQFNQLMEQENYPADSRLGNKLFTEFAHFHEPEPCLDIFEKITNENYIPSPEVVHLLTYAINTLFEQDNIKALIQSCSRIRNVLLQEHLFKFLQQKLHEDKVFRPQLLHHLPLPSFPLPPHIETHSRYWQAYQTAFYCLLLDQTDQAYEVLSSRKRDIHDMDPSNNTLKCHTFLTTELFNQYVAQKNFQKAIETINILAPPELKTVLAPQLMSLLITNEKTELTTLLLKDELPRQYQLVELCLRKGQTKEALLFLQPLLAKKDNSDIANLVERYLSQLIQSCIEQPDVHDLIDHLHLLLTGPETHSPDKQWFTIELGRMLPQVVLERIELLPLYPQARDDILMGAISQNIGVGNFPLVRQLQTQILDPIRRELTQAMLVGRLSNPQHYNEAIQEVEKIKNPILALSSRYYICQQMLLYDRLHIESECGFDQLQYGFKTICQLLSHISVAEIRTNCVEAQKISEHRFLYGMHVGDFASNAKVFIIRFEEMIKKVEERAPNHPQLKEGKAILQAFKKEYPLYRITKLFGEG